LLFEQISYLKGGKDAGVLASMIAALFRISVKVMEVVLTDDTRWWLKQWA